MRHLVIPTLNVPRLNCQFHGSLITVWHGVFREGNIAELSLAILFRQIQLLEQE